MRTRGGEQGTLGDPHYLYAASTSIHVKGGDQSKRRCGGDSGDDNYNDNNGDDDNDDDDDGDYGG